MVSSITTVSLDAIFLGSRKKQIPFVNESEGFAKFPTYNKFQEGTMTLLTILVPTSPPHVPRSRDAEFTYKFVKCSAVPRVKSSINLRANIIGDSYELDALQTNHLKKFTFSEFHFRPCMPSSSTMRVKTNLLPT